MEFKLDPKAWAINPIAELKLVFELSINEEIDL